MAANTPTTMADIMSMAIMGRRYFLAIHGFLVVSILAFSTMFFLRGLGGFRRS